jgi:mitochondrial import receptor subunit TOM40
MSSSEKVVDIYEIAASKARRSTSSFWSNLYSRFAQWREELNLPNPGTVESLQREVKRPSISPLLLLGPFAYFFVYLSPVVHLASYAFDGGRADLNKSLSINPIFQVQHSFHLGSQFAPSSYSFGAIFVQGKVRLIEHHFMQQQQY